MAKATRGITQNPQAGKKLPWVEKERWQWEKIVKNREKNNTTAILAALLLSLSGDPQT
jgi:hypothetical protein